MNFECARCGYCCTFRVILTTEEINNIKKLNITDFFEKDQENNNIIKRKENGDCLFLERKNNKTLCKIYSSRPKPCRDYPPYPQNKPCREFNPLVRAYLYRIKINKK
ncbi:MAG: YkgJ family cysteine cluster protein [Nanoarchaeota archaeon]|nr:YkgJ family cysteine cluster protein [Nanoarchaeota archaeon]MBU1622300.1 YkgJ family cysteine cluster protein [Nanoarchaeota archaeon]MBU1973805.1 YkgJ family cysteine cluster protein [Nanoarchaeota archaeon]